MSCISERHGILLLITSRRGSLCDDPKLGNSTTFLDSFNRIDIGCHARELNIFDTNCRNVARKKFLPSIIGNFGSPLGVIFRYHYVIMMFAFGILLHLQMINRGNVQYLCSSGWSTWGLQSIFNITTDLHIFLYDFTCMKKNARVWTTMHTGNASNTTLSLCKWKLEQHPWDDGRIGVARLEVSRTDFWVEPKKTFCIWFEDFVYNVNSRVQHSQMHLISINSRTILKIHGIKTDLVPKIYSGMFAKVDAIR